MVSKGKNRFEVIGKDDSSRTEKLAAYCARIAYEGRAEGIDVLNISKLCSYADYFVIATGQNTTQIKSIAHNAEVEMKANGLSKIGAEGIKDSGWILLDYGDIIVQLFEAEEREYYRLEDLWADAPKMNWEKIAEVKKTKSGEEKND